MSTVAPQSLANLKPGNRLGTRNRITKEYTTKLTEFLLGDFDAFIGELQSLAPRDRVVAKLKLMDMIIPKKQELEVESIETPKWEIRRAQDRPKNQIEDVAHEVVEEAPAAPTTPATSELVRTAELLLSRQGQVSVASIEAPEATPVVTINRAPRPRV